MSSWDDPETAEYYEAFCSRHTRYIRANAELIKHAQLVPNMDVLDLAAGTGRTAEAVLQFLGDNGKLLCVEPHAGMRIEGMRRLADPRVEWSAVLPGMPESFDRILCGAAIWQLHPLPETFRVLAHLLRPGGALAFNIPALYLMEPDEPGGGSDPLLLSLPALLFESIAGEPALAHDRLTSACIDSWLNAAGLQTQSWSFRQRLTQAAYADWLKIPVLTAHMLNGLTPKARAQRIDEAMESVDCSSWKWEQWRGWTASKV